jgi:hypothetical protein
MATRRRAGPKGNPSGLATSWGLKSQVRPDSLRADVVTSAIATKGGGWLMCQFTRWDGISAAVAGAVGTIVDLAQSRFNLAQHAMETRHVALMAESKCFIYHRPAALGFVKLVLNFECSCRA